jgi:hypothetical protein
MTTKPAFPALGADVTGVGALEPSCRGFGIAKILKKRQLHAQVDVGLDNSGKNVARAAAVGRFPAR